MISVSQEPDPANNPPSRPQVSISPAEPEAGDDLMAHASGSVDPDGDEVTYRYAWYKDEVLQPNLTDDTISADLTLAGEVWKVLVTPNDGQEDGPAAEAALTILEDPTPNEDEDLVTKHTVYIKGEGTGCHRQKTEGRLAGLFWLLALLIFLACSKFTSWKQKYFHPLV